MCGHVPGIEPDDSKTSHFKVRQLGCGNGGGGSDDGEDRYRVRLRFRCGYVSPGGSLRVSRTSGSQPPGQDVRKTPGSGKDNASTTVCEAQLPQGPDDLFKVVGGFSVYYHYRGIAVSERLSQYCREVRGTDLGQAEHLN